MVEVDETDQLYEDTRGIYEAFSPLKVKPMRDLLSDRCAAAQNLFSLAVRTGWETHGIELDEPTYKYIGFAENKGQRSSTRLSDGEMSSSTSGSTRSWGSASGRNETSAPKLPPRAPREAGKGAGPQEEKEKQRLAI